MEIIDLPATTARVLFILDRRSPLSDAAAWAIVCSPDTDAEALSRQIGVKASTIRNACAVRVGMRLV